MKLHIVAICLAIGLNACVNNDELESQKQTSQFPKDYSALSDFSDSLNNDTSTWSYRIKTDRVRDGNYDLMTESGIQSIWQPNTFCWISNNQAGIGSNATGSPITYVGNQYAFNWPQATLWLHPLQNGLVILSWLSPRDGNVTINYSFDDIDVNGIGRGGDGIIWYVDLGDENGNLDSGTINEGAGGTGILEMSSVMVKAGDRINFIVDPNNNYLFDSTAVIANISFLDP